MEGSYDMEVIMTELCPHLKEGVNHYNRTWEAIDRWVKTINRNDNSTKAINLCCKKKVVRSKE